MSRAATTSSRVRAAARVHYTRGGYTGLAARAASWRGRSLLVCRETCCAAHGTLGLDYVPRGRYCVGLSPCVSFMRLHGEAKSERIHPPDEFLGDATCERAATSRVQYLEESRRRIW